MKNTKFIKIFLFLALTVTASWVWSDSWKTWVTRNPASESVEKPHLIFNYKFKTKPLVVDYRNYNLEEGTKKATYECLEYYKKEFPSVMEEFNKKNEVQYNELMDICSHQKEDPIQQEPKKE